MARDVYAAKLRQGSYPALAPPNTERTSIHFAARLAASESIVNYTRGPVWAGEPTEKKTSGTACWVQTYPQCEKKTNGTACWVQTYPQCFRYGLHIEMSLR